MKKMIAMAIIAVIGAYCLYGCDETYTGSSSGQESAYQEQLMQQSAEEVGNPDITEFYEKKLAKEIFEKRDDSDLICYVYNQNYDGHYIYVGKSMGYGLPYSTQYTAPEKLKQGGYANTGYWAVTVPQADPNGLYSADGLSATWLMMIDEETGENYIMYCEPTIVVTENPLPDRLIAEWSLPE